MSGPVPALTGRAADCAERLLAADAVLVVSHIDADGLTSAAIASAALARADVPHEVAFSKQLDESEVATVAATDYDTVCFTDFGSGQLDVIGAYEAAGAFTPVVVDHHQPADATTTYHLNPLLEGVDGASELSGAGAAYVLARALADATDEGRAATDGGAAGTGTGAEADPDAQTDPDPDPDTDADVAAGTASSNDEGGRATAAAPGAGPVCPGTAADPANRDLAALAVVGAVGDMQDGRDGLTGANEAVVAEAEAAGVLEAGRDLTLYGKQTRPLPKLLEYASDVRIPGVTNDEAGAIEFLSELDLPLKRDGEWRRWVDLTGPERRTVASALLRRAVASGVPVDRAESLVGTSYTLPGEEVGTELRDVSEFSTLLNATARYERADVGLAVCLGARGEPLDRARQLLRTHRRNLSEGLQWVTTEGVSREGYDHLQWFDAGTEIRETIVGIVAGMAFGGDGVDRDRPIVAFAAADEGELKVSARGTAALVRRGLDLSAVMGDASRAVGGDGGGHDVAAGATIPADRRDEFLAAADAAVGEQLG
jgi:RecJ-like exonuclease